MPCGGVQSTFSVLEASEVKFPALRGFVLPTDIHVSRGTRLGFHPLFHESDLVPLFHHLSGTLIQHAIEKRFREAQLIVSRNVL